MKLLTGGLNVFRVGNIRSTLGRLMLVMLAVAMGLMMSPAKAEENVKVRLDFLPYGLHAPFYYAVEKGWFKEKGLNVEIDDGNGSGPATALVAAGRYDIAYAVLSSAIMGRDKGMPIKAIANVVRKGDYGAVYDSSLGIKSPQDLEGKTILYSAGSFETTMLDAYLKKIGVEKSKVKLINVDLSAKISSYMAGKGDVMFTTVPLYILKEFTPRASDGMLFADVGLGLPSSGLITNESTIKERPQMLKDFVAVFQRSWKAIYEDGELDPAIDALLKHRPNANLNRGFMKAQVESFYPFLNTEATKDQPLLWMPPSDWQETIDIMKEQKLVGPDAEAESMYTNEFIPASS
ncbi:ABC transporter substrate-binding protein [Pusillimonas sp.]|uniref:ABC transporter substrate-binding protein n=1 Tax=Pusillimonas sp. TaxID=3040095 RepID=UPI0037CC9616